MTPTLQPRLVNGRYGDPALFVELLHAREALLFDCGDLRALSARDLLRVGHLFLSHLHMDHFVGFDGLLRVLVGREKTVRVVGPAGAIAAVGHKLAAYQWDLVGRYGTELVFEVAELVAPERVRRTRFRFLAGFAPEPLAEAHAPGGLVADAPGFGVRAAILEHHGPCLGFAIAEPVHVKIWRNRLEERGLAPGPWLQGLKAAVRVGAGDDRPVATPGGVAPLGALRGLVSVERGQKLGYVTDVRDTPANRAAIVALCGAADILFIEASFAAAEVLRAFDRAHLTTTAAGEIARAAGARRLEAFHFSPRHEGAEAAMLAEVAAAFRGEGARGGQLGDEPVSAGDAGINPASDGLTDVTRRPR